MSKTKKSEGHGLWLVTGALVLLIIGGAVYVSKKRLENIDAVSVVQQAAVIAESVVDVEDDMLVEDLDTLDIEVVEPVESVDEDGNPVPLLNNLAGVLDFSIPVLVSAENRLPLEYTCHRTNMSPPLSWEAAPENTKSFVLLLEQRKLDQKSFLSWALFNIPGDSGALDSRAPTKGEWGDGMKQALSDHNTSEYVGPCDPQGKIPYAFRLFALDTVLDIEAGVGKYDLIRAMNGHIIDAAEAKFIHYLRF